MNIVSTIKANKQSAELVKPSDGAFDDPAMLAQMRGILDTPSSDPVLDPADGTGNSTLVEIVPLVCVEFLWPASRPAMAILQRGHSVQQRLKHRGIMGVGSGKQYRQWNPVPICYQMVFAARTPPIHWIPPRLRPPFLPVRLMRRYRLDSNRSSRCRATLAVSLAAGVPTPPPPATRVVGASTSSRCRSPFPAAAIPTRSLSSARR